MTRHDVDPAAAYVKDVLDIYRRALGTTGRVRSSDRRLAEELCRRGVSVSTVESALLLATLRRLVRPSEKTPLAIVRSLAYYEAVIQEVHAEPLDPGYVLYLKSKLARTLHSH